jgi:hypothetical protein
MKVDNKLLIKNGDLTFSLLRACRVCDRHPGGGSIRTFRVEFAVTPLFLTGGKDADTRNMPTYPRRSINGLLQERDQLQDELNHAGSEEKPGLIRDIKAINRRLNGLQKQLADCIVANPTLPPIEGIFTGTSELTTTYSSAPGPF